MIDLHWDMGYREVLCQYCNGNVIWVNELGQQINEYGQPIDSPYSQMKNPPSIKGGTLVIALIFYILFSLFKNPKEFETTLDNKTVAAANLFQTKKNGIKASGLLTIKNNDRIIITCGVLNSKIQGAIQTQYKSGKAEIKGAFLDGVPHGKFSIKDHNSKTELTYSKGILKKAKYKVKGKKTIALLDDSNIIKASETILDFNLYLQSALDKVIKDNANTNIPYSFFISFKLEHTKIWFVTFMLSIFFIIIYMKLKSAQFKQTNNNSYILQNSGYSFYPNNHTFYNKENLLQEMNQYESEEEYPGKVLIDKALDTYPKLKQIFLPKNQKNIELQKVILEDVFQNLDKKPEEEFEAFCKFWVSYQLADKYRKLNIFMVEEFELLNSCVNLFEKFQFPLVVGEGPDRTANIEYMLYMNHATAANINGQFEIDKSSLKKAQNAATDDEAKAKCLAYLIQCQINLLKVGDKSNNEALIKEVNRYSEEFYFKNNYSEQFQDLAMHCALGMTILELYNNQKDSARKYLNQYFNLLYVEEFLNLIEKEKNPINFDNVIELYQKMLCEERASKPSEFYYIVDSGVIDPIPDIFNIIPHKIKEGTGQPVSGEMKSRLDELILEGKLDIVQNEIEKVLNKGIFYTHQSFDLIYWTSSVFVDKKLCNFRSLFC